MQAQIPSDPPYLVKALRVMPWLVFGLLAVTAFLMLAPVAPPSNSADPDTLYATSVMLRKILSLLLIGATVVWFILCFTGDPAQRQHAAFVFAYAFTFGAFAMLVLPLASSTDRTQHPPEGALQLVRGCLVGQGTSASAPAGLSAMVNCPNPRWSGAARDPHEVARDYGWLVTVGGVAVRRYAGDLAAYAPSGAASAPGDASLTGAQNKANPATPPEFLEVHGGMAVPLFVVVLAFVGGAVSLSRRLPEYQRRTEPGYQPTAKEPAMKPFQARESVVFQIMQLVSAPFLAMATWYMIEPSTLAVAIVLAFGTGFASEYLLLMIRGMVEGIRPETTRPATAPGVPLAGRVVRADGMEPVADVTVLLKSASTTEMRALPSGADGKFTFAAVQPGQYTLVCNLPNAQPQDVTVGDVQPPAVQLVAP